MGRRWRSSHLNQRAGTALACSTSGGSGGGVGEVEGSADQREVAERLGEVAGHPALAGVVLLGEQTDVVDQPDQPVEERVRVVEAAGGGSSWAPDRLWDYWTGGDEVDPVVTVDDERMQTTIQRLDGELGTAPVDGTVTFTGSTVRTTEATTGRVLDDEAVREALVAAYLSEEPTAELDLVEVEPDITDADVEQAVEDYANPALSGPVTLVFGDTPVKLRPADYAKALTLDADGGEIIFKQLGYRHF